MPTTDPTSFQRSPFAIRLRSWVGVTALLGRQSGPAVAVRAPGLAVMLSFVVLFPAAVVAQMPVQRQRERLLILYRNQPVEAAVINDVILIFGDAEIVGHGAPADDIEIDHRPQRVALFSGTFADLVYGRGSGPTDVRTQLENRLRESLDKIDRALQLTDAQRRKLQLAGRGDLQRYFDRANELRVMCDRYAEITSSDQFQKWSEDLKSEASALRQRLVEGPFDKQSLLAKTMTTTLTAQQAEKYADFVGTAADRPPERRRVRFKGAIELGDP